MQPAILELTPRDRSYGELSVGCEASSTLHLYNEGPSPLILTGASVADPEFWLEPELDLPLDLAGGELLEVELHCRPLDGEPDQAGVRFWLSEPTAMSLPGSHEGTGRFVGRRQDVFEQSDPPVARFPLVAPAVEGTVELRVDAVLVRLGWGLDVEGEALVFEDPAVPPVGSEIDVRYAMQPEDCEPP